MLVEEESELLESISYQQPIKGYLSTLCMVPGKGSETIQKWSRVIKPEALLP
jgi:hypothetical protein